jgi:hypothetical protein
MEIICPERNNMPKEIVPENELKKFWEWCGLKIDVTYPSADETVGWGMGIPEYHMPELTLDNLFKYAVPKLRRLKHLIVDEICFAIENSEDTVMILWWTGRPKTDSYGVGVFSGKGETPQEALYKAILEVING